MLLLAGTGNSLELCNHAILLRRLRGGRSWGVTSSIQTRVKTVEERVGIYVERGSFDSTAVGSIEGFVRHVDFLFETDRGTGLNGFASYTAIHSKFPLLDLNRAHRIHKSVGRKVCLMRHAVSPFCVPVTCPTNHMSLDLNPYQSQPGTLTNPHISTFHRTARHLKLPRHHHHSILRSRTLSNPISVCVSSVPPYRTCILSKLRESVLLTVGI
jgi:hypothetical protein